LTGRKEIVYLCERLKMELGKHFKASGKRRRTSSDLSNISNIEKGSIP
jgi:hypothetical protein